MSLSGSERSSRSCERQSRSGTRQRKLFRKRDKRSRSSERYEFSDLEDDIFVRGPRKLRREDVEGELSYDYANPGRLKVFTAGLNRCAGQPEFCTVLVNAADTTADIINEVLQRCDILYSDGDEFFLCESIGKLEPYHQSQHLHHGVGATQFVEQCRRIIGPDEHVLVIQALWKPLFGYYRRFELKQVSPSDSNGKKKRHRRRCLLRLWQSGSAGSDFYRDEINGSERERDESESSQEEDSQGRRKTWTPRSHRNEASTQVEPGDLPTLAKGRARGFGTQTETVYFASADRRFRKKCSVPLGPYLLLLKGFDTRHDLLVNDLFDLNLLGSDDRRCDIHLRCADVMPEHCVIEACHSEVEGAKPYCMSVAPVGASEVLLNGQLIDRKHVLSPGDVISIGAGEMCSYVFMFKDASHVPDRSIGLAWLMFLESAQRSIDLHQLLESGGENEHRQTAGAAAAAAVGSFVSTTVPSDSVLDTPRCDSDINRESNAQQLAQASLGSLLALYFNEAIDLQYASGLLVLLAVYVTDLELEQASVEIQWHITDSVVTLSKKVSQMQDQRDKAQCYAEMIQACALAFEIFLFFHEVCGGSNGGSGLTAAAVKCQQWRDYCETTMQQMLENIFNHLGEEVLAQSAALCDTGLGSTAKQKLPAKETQLPSMEGFITLLTQISNAFANPQYHCVTTLRLMVMKRLMFQVAKTFTLRLFSDDPTAYLKWNCAVQLRVNLDQLEEWLREEGLDRFLTALDLPNCLVDLVATPKSHLVTMSWQAMRGAFPLIPPSLLRRTLAEYETRSGPVSGIWRVSPEDLKEAGYSVTCAIEDHFQLAIEDCQIPVEDVKPSVQLHRLLEDSEFDRVTRHLDQQTGASNCRLQWHQVASHIRTRLVQNRLFSDPSRRAASAAAAAAATNQDSTAAVGLGDSDSGSNAGGDDEAIFYDSLSGSDKSADQNQEESLKDVGIDSTVSAVNSVVRVSVQRTPNSSSRPQQQRPKTPTPANPFAPADLGRHEYPNGQADSGRDEDDTLSSLADSFTLANTLRNEMIAAQQTEDSEELDSETCDASLELYRQHTKSFVIAPEPAPYQDPPPPPPPPRSCSLNGQRTQIQRHHPHQQSLPKVAAKPPSPPRDAKTHRREKTDDAEASEVFLVTLSRSSPGQSYGMELIDGEKTTLASHGVFIRSLAADSPAAVCRRLSPGDRIVAVNSHSLEKLPYASCLGLIKASESVLHLLVARPSAMVVTRVLTAATAF